MNPNGNLNAKVSKLLVVVIVLQSLTIAGQWLGGGASSAPRILPAAEAQFANAGADRQAMVDELKQTNNKLDKIYSALTGGNIQVKAVLPDDQKGGNAPKGGGNANNGAGNGAGSVSVSRSK
jgi:hypothetical protein